MSSIHCTVKGVWWDEKCMHSYSSYSTSVGEKGHAWGKSDFTSDNRKEAQHQDCDLSAGKGRASWCLQSLCLPRVFCICKRQPALPCLEKPSRDSWLSVSCFSMRQHLLLRSCQHPESSYFLSKQDGVTPCTQNHCPSSGTAQTWICLWWPGKSKACSLSVYSLTSCTVRGVWRGEDKKGGKFYSNFIVA